jgi:hypothetical protein
MEMSSGGWGTFSRAVMEHVEGQVMDLVPEADRKETLAMLFGPPSILTLTYDGRRPSKASRGQRG